MTTHRIATPLRDVLFWLAIALLVAGCVVVLRSDRAERSAGADRPDLQRVLDSAVTGRGRIAPGATAYVDGPNGTWRGAAGIADVRAGTPMQPDARMRLESVSKVFTATLILQLAQEGRLTLEDSVERWQPDLLPYGGELTIRQLLTMSSGLIDTNDVARRPAAYLARVKDAHLRGQLEAIVARAAADPTIEVSPRWWIKLAAWQPLRFAPGTPRATA